MFVKPADDRKVRDPLTKRHIPADGVDVPDSSYWQRRIKDGDVLLVNPESAQAEAESQKTQQERSVKRSSKE